MKKIITALTLALALPTAAFAAADNVGGCGLGSMVFKGQSGIVPQVLAVTTNGTSGNQTFGITTGTLGCTSDGTVTSNMQASLFIETNKSQLARDMSVGGGETLASLSQLIGVEAKDQAAFNSATKENMARIFSTSNVETAQVISGLREVLASNAQLSRYQTAL
ncbi:MAG: DUF3015 domain-containing protein [Gallionella sp.]